MEQVTDAQTGDSAWKSLYRFGGVTPWITLAAYLTQVLAMIFGDLAGEPFPATTEGWFSLFQRSRPLGLLYLNALDPFSIALLGAMFLALTIALRQVSESSMAIAALIAFIGIAVFVALRVSMVSATLVLSDQYAAAATEADRSQLLAASQAIAAPTRPTPQTAGFLFIAIAGLIISVVMLRSDIFNKATAYVGILAGVVTFADHACLIVAPSIAGILMPADGLLWIVWWILVSLGLLRLGKRTPQEAANRN